MVTSCFRSPLAARPTDYYAATSVMTNPGLSGVLPGVLSIVRQRFVGRGMHDDIEKENVRRDGDYRVEVAHECDSLRFRYQRGDFMRRLVVWVLYAARREGRTLPLPTAAGAPPVVAPLHQFPDARRPADAHLWERRPAGHEQVRPAFPYYGTIDTTPLFVILITAVYQATGDIELVRALRGHAERALAWMEQFGDRDGDGYLEYAREGDIGLENQGWKDSWYPRNWTTGGRFPQPVSDG